jgi:hypothetical protein
LEQQKFLAQKTNLMNQELKQAGIKKKQVWRPKDKPDESGRSAHTCMVCFLPNEFMAPASQIVQEEVLPDMDEAEQFGLMAQLIWPRKLFLISQPRIGT